MHTPTDTRGDRRGLARLCLLPSQPFLFQRARKPRVKAGVKEKSQPISTRFEETDQVWVQRKLLGGGEDGMSVVPRKMASLEWFAWNYNETGLETSILYIYVLYSTLLYIIMFIYYIIIYSRVIGDRADTRNHQSFGRREPWVIPLGKQRCCSVKWETSDVVSDAVSRQRIKWSPLFFLPFPSMF